jgi:hypothetical protein
LIDVRSAVRRFRAGLDYTVAHYGAIVSEPRYYYVFVSVCCALFSLLYRLAATLCFCDESDVAKPSSTATKSSTDNNERPAESIWRGGDVGMLLSLPSHLPRQSKPYSMIC